MDGVQEGLNDMMVCFFMVLSPPPSSSQKRDLFTYELTDLLTEGQTNLFLDNLHLYVERTNHGIFISRDI